MARQRNRREIPEGGTDLGSASAENVTDLTMPKDVPRNADGSVALEGEVSAEQARAIGAVDAESAGKNKQVAKLMADKLQGKNVKWNTEDALEMYAILRHTHGNMVESMTIHVVRVEPTRVHMPPVHASRIPDGPALYKYIETCHGRSNEAKYEVYFRSSYTQLGKGTIYMPNCAPVPEAQAPQAWQPPPGYGPQQAPVVVVGSPSLPAAPAPVAPVPVPAPTMAAPSPSGNAELAALMKQMNDSAAATQSAMFAMVKELVETTRRPPGFIPVPDDYPYAIPQGFIRVPGGMFPDPRGLGVAPAPIPVPAPAAQPHVVPAQMVPVRAPSPEQTISQQFSGFASSAAEVFRGMKEIQKLATQFAGPTQAIEPEESEYENPIGPRAEESPIMTQDVGGLAMAIDRRTGKTVWPQTLIGAAPKLMEVAKGVIGEWSKAQEKNASIQKQQVEDRIRLAHAVANAQRPAPAPATLPQQRPAPPPSPPVQAAPPPPPPPPPAPSRSSMPVPAKPLFG